MKYHFKVEGMTCNKCALYIQSVLKQNKEIGNYIESIQIDHMTGEMVVELKERISSFSIIRVIKTETEGFTITCTATFDEFKTYYFELSPKSPDDNSSNSASDSSSNENPLQSIADSLNMEYFVSGAIADPETNRLKVVTTPSGNDREVIKCIEALNYRAKLLPSRNTFNFMIKGLATAEQERMMEESLEAHKVDVDSFQVRYSSNTVTVTVPSDKEPLKIAAQKQRVMEIINNAINDSSISIEEIAGPYVPEDISAESPAKYFSHFRLNLYVGGFFFILNFFGFVFSPLTLLGQLVNLALGGITLGVMWKTGKEFYSKAWQKFIKMRTADMDAMIALGTGVAWIYNMALTLFPSFFTIAVQPQFLAVCMTLGIINFGRAIRAKALEKTYKKSQNLAEVYVSFQNQLAKRVIDPNSPGPLEDKMVEGINFKQIKAGDILEVEKGKLIPVEGIVESGESAVNLRAITGESKLCSIKKGSKVFSGTLNDKNTIYVEATCDGAKGKLIQLIESVAETDKKSRMEGSRISSLVDTVAKVLVPVVVGLSCLSGLAWFFFGPAPHIDMALRSLTATLLCACPCAVMLATPISSTISIYKLFNKDIFIKDVNVLSQIAKLKVIYFDKTDTLTEVGPFLKENVFFEIPVRDASETRSEKALQEERLNEILCLVASVEDAYLKANYDHPIARILVAENPVDQFKKCTNVKNGEHGVSGIINEKTILIGSRTFLEKHSPKINKIFKDKEDENDKKGLTSIYVAEDGKCIAVIGLGQRARKEAREEIKRLQDLKIQVCMLTGDNESAAKAIASDLGINPLKVFWGHTDKEKEKKIADSQKKYCTGMVGDGMNDWLALGVAGAKIAAGYWSSAAVKADIIVKNLNISTLIVIARETVENIKLNLWITCFYNVLSLSAAMGLFHFMGIAITAPLASAIMSLSSLCVVTNSARLASVIDEEIDLVEKNIKLNWLEKLYRFLSFKKLGQTLKMFFSEENEDKVEKKYVENPLPRMIPSADRAVLVAGVPSKSHYIAYSSSSPTKSVLPQLIKEENSSPSPKTMYPVIPLDDSTRYSPPGTPPSSPTKRRMGVRRTLHEYYL